MKPTYRPDRPGRGDRPASPRRAPADDPHAQPLPETDLPIYHAKTLAGLESLVEAELRNHGAEILRVGRRGIDFGADMETLFRVCMCSRFALRILRPILQFEAQDAQDLYEQATQWDWLSVMEAKSTFAIDSTV